MTDCTRHITSCFLGLALSVAFVAAPAIAQNAVADSGLFVTVPNPLTSDGYTRIKNRIDAARSKPDARPSVVIFDFNPNDKDANTPDVGPCYDLGDYIAKLTDTATVGYVHQKGTPFYPFWRVKSLFSARKVCWAKSSVPTSQC